jgi:hypothetical protein
MLKRRSHTELRFQLDVTIIFSDDIVRSHQSQTPPIAFGGKIGIEYFGKMLFGDADAVIAYRDLYVFSFRK